MVVPGGWSETLAPTEEVQKICDQVKPQVEKMTGRNFLEFKAVKYRYQVVAGENYLIKVYVGEKDYFRLSLFQPLPCDGFRIVIRGVQLNKTKDDPLIPFP